MNPFVDGLRMTTGIDLFAKGMDQAELYSIYYGLISDREQERLLMESATLDEIDEAYNQGEIEMVLEAITVKKFAQTESKMRALVRTLNMYALKGVAALDAQIGKPRKSGLFATVTVQIPMSDGQIVSIVFHSPTGDEKKILPDDMIVAFRWLLNKRDITHTVSPERGKDVSLQTVAKRVMQLVAKNSEAFQKAQTEIVAQKEELAAAEQSVQAQEAHNQEVQNQIADTGVEVERIEDEIETTRRRLERIRQENDDLEARLEEMRAKKQEQVASAKLAELRDRARDLGFDAEADQLYLAKDESGLQSLIDSKTAAPEPEPEPEPEMLEVSILPSAEQTGGNPAKRAAKILYALGKAEDAMKDGFHAEVKRGGHQDLIIETSDAGNGLKAIRFAQEGVGEMSFSTTTGNLKLTEVVFSGPMGEVRRTNIGRAEKSWANTFSKSLIDQGFGDIKAGGEDEKNYMDYLLSNLAEADRLESEAKEKGLSPMSREQFMEQINSGERQGFSVDYLNEKLAEHKASLAGLDNGTVSPGEIVGKGGSKIQAQNWLNEQIEKITYALDSGGFAHNSNVMNYNSYLRKLIQGSEKEGEPKITMPAEIPAADLPSGWKAKRTTLGITYVGEFETGTVGIDVTARNDGKFNVLTVRKGGEVQEDHAVLDEDAANKEALRRMKEESGKAGSEPIPEAMKPIAIPSERLPDGWARYSDPTEYVQIYQGPGGASIRVSKLLSGGGEFVVSMRGADGTEMRQEKVAGPSAANEKALEFMRAPIYGLPDDITASLSPGDTVYFELASGWKTGNWRGLVPDDHSKSVVVYDGGNQIAIDNADLRLEMPEEMRHEPWSEPTPPNPEPETRPEAVKILNQIVSGEFDDSPAQIDSLLDQAAEDLEAAGLMEQYDGLLNKAADHYTEVLRKEAA